MCSIIGPGFSYADSVSGENFIREVRTASSTNLLAALKAKMKHMPSLYASDLWRSGKRHFPPVALSRELFSVRCIEIATPWCPSTWLRKHLLHHPRATMGTALLTTCLLKGYWTPFICPVSVLCNYRSEGV